MKANVSTLWIILQTASSESVLRRLSSRINSSRHASCVFLNEARVIPVYNGSSDLLSVVMEETGGLGVDVVVDSGGKNICGDECVCSNKSFKFQLKACFHTQKLRHLCFFVPEVRLHEMEEELEEKKYLPHKHDIISVLAVGGHWVTSHQDLQVSRHQMYKPHHDVNISGGSFST